LSLRRIDIENMVDVNQHCNPHHEICQVLKMAREENSGSDDQLDGHRHEHAHPVAKKDLVTLTGVELRPHVDIEEPFRTAQHGLLPATENASYAGPAGDH